MTLVVLASAWLHFAYVVKGGEGSQLLGLEYIELDVEGSILQPAGI